MRKESPVSKIYEALSALSDGRVRSNGTDEWLVLSSDHSKYYTVRRKDGVYSSNDNATLWQHYAGYPILAVWMKEGLLPVDASVLPALANIPWKALNVKHRNKYEESIAEVRSSWSEEEDREIQAEILAVQEALKKIPNDVKGNRVPLGKEETFALGLADSQA